MKTIFENKVEITEIMNTESQTIVRSILINGNLVYEERTTAVLDHRSTSNLKQFIDWLIGYEIKTAVKKKSFLHRLTAKIKWK